MIIIYHNDYLIEGGVEGYFASSLLGPDDHQPYDQCVNHDQYGNQDSYRSFDPCGGYD